MRGRTRQQGLSLVELMVALLVGMVLMVGFLQIFMSIRTTYATNEASSRVQENGRFALDFLAGHARLAGYRDPKHIDRPLPIMPPTGNGCTVPTSRQEAFCTVERGVVATPEAGDETGDRVAFVYQPPLETGNTRRDCTGNSVPAADEDKNWINVFTTKATAGNAALVCRSVDEEGATANQDVELVEGIDAVQFQYGLAPNGFVTQYVRADQVTNWNHVAALRIAVLANSISTVNPAPPADKQYYLLDAGPYTFSDGRMRQVFTTTVYLRNSLQ